ncbi:MAG: hypothetical protein ACRC31_03945, partial [Cetobacterium sp.]
MKDFYEIKIIINLEEGVIMNIDFTEKIIGKEKYFNSAGIALVIEKNDKKYFLFEKRARGVRQGGDVS